MTGKLEVERLRADAIVSIVDAANQMRADWLDRFEIVTVVACVAQYWDDEASDAVHLRLVVSKLTEPDLKRGLDRYGDRNKDHGGDPNLPDGLSQWDVATWERTQFWQNNGWAVPVAAAWCRDGGSQELPDSANFTEFIRLNWADDHWGTSLSPKLRPWLDGVWSQDRIEWPAADEVWNRAQVTLPPQHRRGDRALAELLHVRRVIDAAAADGDMRWTWTYDNARHGAPREIDATLEAVRAAADRFWMTDLVAALDTIAADPRSDSAQATVADMCTHDAIRTAFERYYSIFSYDFSPVRWGS